MTDGELARRVAGGDRAAAAALIERHHRPVRRFLARLVPAPDLADDLAQETFVRMLRYADRYDERYPMRTWLLTIARRLSINAAQRNRRMIASDQFDYCTSPDAGPGSKAERNDENRHLRARLSAALLELTDAQREAVVLFHQQELSVQEVAAAMGVPVGTVKSHLHRGRAAMRRALARDPQLSRPL